MSRFVPGPHDAIGHAAPPARTAPSESRPATPISARRIAELLGLPEPTPEQAAVIEAPLSPALVVAGAGSGKTETMANRIVWLLANRHVRVDEVLGLTFTRKAASELAHRVRDRVAQLRSIAGSPDAPYDDVLAAPTIATYNSFASGLFREHARLIGREPDQIVITEASAWRLARQVVIASDDDRLADLDKNVDTITGAVIAIARALGDNDAWDATDAVRRLSQEFTALPELPLSDGSTAKRTPSRSLVDACRDVGSLPLLVDLASAFASEKRRRGLIEFSDQVALALDICRRAPRVTEDYRSRYRVVILDEYQDTSVVQTDLLSRLFADHPVMAVGDPNQSIYGWRGASAANLARFAADFARDQTPAAFTLSTSWRNSSRILDAANAIVASLPIAESVPVTRLTTSPWAEEGEVSAVVLETIVDEADAVAEWLQRELSRPATGGRQRSAAMLCRSLKQIGVFTDALERRGVPFHVLGVAGLLEQPVIVDLLCVLRVLGDPSAGSELIRLLTGARWRIGPRDIKALSSLARWLADRDLSQQRIPEETRKALFESSAADDGRSIVDALDFLQTAPDGHRALAEFSEQGLARMREAARQLTSIRRRHGLDLHDLVGLVVHEFLLDVEVAANERSVLGRASLDAFSEQVSSFLAIDERGTLAEFLSWLDEAERRENLSPRSEDPEPGTVQILTIHGAKGLEWDSVVVPRMVEDELPGPLRSKRGWTAFGELPYEFRGDRHELPVLAWRAVSTQAEFDRAYAAFGQGLEDRHADEQRRLAYVAVTRARESLLLTGSFWASQRKPRGPSRFLQEVVAAVPSSSSGLPETSVHDENPLAQSRSGALWPLDPLGPRAYSVHAAAAAVLRADPTAPTRWSSDLDLLLAERDRRGSADEWVEAPNRVPASRFKDFVSDPQALATRMRRPVPEKPYRQTRIGTLFHAWVEQRAGVSGGQEELDSTLLEQDLDDLSPSALTPLGEHERDLLDRLRRTFEASEWADLKPVDVEREINVVLGSRIIICKLDAVYVRDGRYQIVDWKTGRAPTTEEQREERELQLALYRLAWSRWKGVDPELIDAVFYYVADDRVIRPERLYSEKELLERWSAALSS